MYSALLKRTVTTCFPPRPGGSAPIKVALIPGNGIGPETCLSVVKVIEKVHAPIQWEEFLDIDPGNDQQIQRILDCKAALKGVIAHKIGAGPSSPNILLRKRLNVFAAVTHAYNIEGLRSVHNNVNVITVRENTEGEYSGLEHEVYPGVVESIKVTTRDASERVANYAFELAFMNNRKKVTAVHKANIMKLVDGEFLKASRAAAKRYPQIKYEEMIIDNASMQMVSRPQQFDVLLLPNLYGSIMANLAGAVSGGVGIQPGVNVGNDFAVFEQGARHMGLDIAGQNKANPTGALLASVMMLRYLNLPHFAYRIQDAVFKTIQGGRFLTIDMGGKATTEDFTKAVIENIEV